MQTKPASEPRPWIPNRTRSHGPDGTPTELAGLFAAHAPGLIRWMTAFTRDGELAEDLVQDAFVRLARELQAGRRPDNPPAWLALVTRNLASAGRAETRRPSGSRPGSNYPAPAIDPAASALATERAAAVHAALATLRPVDRRALSSRPRAIGPPTSPPTSAARSSRRGRCCVAHVGGSVRCCARSQPGDGAPRMIRRRWVDLRRSRSSGVRASWRRRAGSSDARWMARPGSSSSAARRASAGAGSSTPSPPTRATLAIASPRAPASGPTAVRGPTPPSSRRSGR